VRRLDFVLLTIASQNTYPETKCTDFSVNLKNYEAEFRHW